MTHKSPITLHAAMPAERMLKGYSSRKVKRTVVYRNPARTNLALMLVEREAKEQRIRRRYNRAMDEVEHWQNVGLWHHAARSLMWAGVYIKALERLTGRPA